MPLNSKLLLYYPKYISHILYRIEIKTIKNHYIGKGLISLHEEIVADASKTQSS